MENTQQLKNATLSFKTTAEEKTALQQIANEKRITRSELISSIVYAYKNHYDFIGKSSPKEESLSLELIQAKKENRRLSLKLENAEYRLEIENNLRKKNDRELFKKAQEVFDLQEQLKVLRSEVTNLKESLNTANLSKESHNVNPKLLYSSIGSLIVSGLTLLFMPKLMR